MYGVPCPNYIRSVKVCNKSNADFVIDVAFKSGKTGKYDVSHGSTRFVEEQVNQGTFTTIDEIVKVDGHPKNHP